MRPEAEASKQSVELLYREHAQRLRRLAQLLVGSTSDAEDLVQSAFVSLSERWDEVQSPKAYLRQVVVNRAADLHRSQRRQLPAAPDLNAGEPDVDEMWTAIQRLQDVQRMVVILRFYEDLSHGEIGRILDRPESTIRSDLRRALLRLREEVPDGR